MGTFDFKKFWQSLSSAEKVKLATDAGTTTNYIKVHLVYCRRTPNKSLMERLYLACKQHDPQVTKEALIGFFYEAA